MPWTTLGAPKADVPAIPEADEPDRRQVVCGNVFVRASGLRIVENFLDMAHFPFVHTDILGAEPHTEVAQYTTEIRRDIDEVWATNCQFFQPQAAMSATGGLMAQYQYRVAVPFVTMLYKTCPNAPDRRDVITLFVQPLDPDRCRAHPVMMLIDDVSSLSALVQFSSSSSCRIASFWKTSVRACSRLSRAPRFRRGPILPRSATGVGSRRRASSTETTAGPAAAA